MKNLDKIYNQVKEYEAKIQAATGEKSALTRQLEQQKTNLEQLEAECEEKFNCTLDELEEKKTEAEEEINTLFLELEKMVKELEK